MPGGGGGCRKEETLLCATASRKPPVEFSRRLFEEAAVISNYRAGTYSSEKEGSLPQSPRELGAELGVEPRTVSVQRQALPRSCVCGAPVTLTAGHPWFTVSGRSNMDGMEDRVLPVCTAFTQPETALQ